MAHWIDLAAQYGCDAVEPDNIDCYLSQACWGVMQNPSYNSANSTAVKALEIQYLTWMAQYAHSKGLAIA